MRYLGGKSRLAKKFAPVLCEALRQGNGVLVEPFVGGFNVVPAVASAMREAWCSDVHAGLIRTYQCLQDGTFDPPSELSEAQYEALRARSDWSDPLTAFAAFGCSFGGKEWGGYARGEGRDFVDEACRNMWKKREHMLACYFDVIPYQQVDVRPGSVVYCDPPYKDTVGYRTGAFDHEEFYAWCEAKRDVGARVFVSEFTRPDRVGWDVMWFVERKVTVALDKTLMLKTELLMEVR